MSKKQYWWVVGFLTVNALFWALAYAYVGDVYPELEVTVTVLQFKAVVSGVLSIGSWFFLPMVMLELP